MDNLARDVREALRLGYGCHYGYYKIDYPNTADHSVELIPDPQDDEPPKRCRNCGKVFVPQNGNQVFCSEICRVDRRQKLNREHKRNREKAVIGQGICPVCGKTFDRHSKKHTYCGRSCAAVVRNKTRRRG